MINNAVILAGGYGTRLGGILKDIPKPMAPVKGRPFLEYVIDYLREYGINNIILSTGYLSHVIERHFGRSYKDTGIAYSVETSPLGTGGAVIAALDLFEADNFVVINGDTLFRAALDELENMHMGKDADISIALRQVDDTGRYGAIYTDQENRIIRFSEKEEQGVRGIINGGIYIINRRLFKSLKMAPVFSIEKDLFALRYREIKMFGMKSEGYFIDIGTPGDLIRASDEL